MKVKPEQSLYEDLKEFENHCEYVGGKEEYPLIFKSTIKDYNALLSKYSKILKNDDILDFSINIDNVNYSGSGGNPYVWPSDFSLKLRRLKHYLKINYEVAENIGLDLIKDDQLRNKCRIMFEGEDNSDTIIMQATTILENRLREKSSLERLKDNKGIKLIDKVLHPSTGLLKISEIDNEREGIYQICRGIYLAYRDETHHVLINEIKNDDALKITLMIDEILLIINNLKIYESTKSKSAKRTGSKN